MLSRILFVSAVLLAVIMSGCAKPEPPDPASEEYKSAVSAFYLSLAAIESDQAVFAVEKMNQVAEQYPREPAAWANLGVFAMRQGNFELAAEQLTKAQNLTDQNGEIQFLLGILESRQGNIEEAIAHLEDAARYKPDDPRIAYALLSELERQDTQTNADTLRSLLTSLSEQQPRNLAVMLEMARISAKLGDKDMLLNALENLTSESENWPAEIRAEFESLRDEIRNQPIENLTFEIAYLRNNLNKLPQFQADFSRIEIPPNQIGFLITEFLWLPEPEKSNDPRDEGITYEQQPLDFDSGQQMVKAISLADDEIPELIAASDSRVTFQDGRELPFPGSRDSAPSMHAVETVDYNYDFLNDLVFAGSDGIRVFEQNEGATFTEVTSQLALPPSVLNGRYSAVWKADIDLDGDLDLVLARPDSSPAVLRNNGDGTFNSAVYFEAVHNPIGFLWADLDADGDPDAAFLGSDGRVSLYINKRAGSFDLAGDFPQADNVKTIEVADLNSDSFLDLVTAGSQGIRQISYNSDQKTFSETSVVSWSDTSLTGNPRLLVNDFDNNGGLDFIISSAEKSEIWLSGEQLDFKKLNLELPGSLYSTSELTGDNRLDIVGLDETGKPFQLTSSGTKQYFGRIIRPRASGSLGDQRINSFGIGGEVEIRSGLLYHKQPITSPDVHFGLGTYEEAAMLRVIWPNGSVQSEFAELGYGSKIFNEQMLKGSCPWVFTYNGEEMEFVTDFLWRTALGLRINAQGAASAIHSIDWIKINGDQLEPKNGYYDVRITAELWETHFFDHVSMMAVDHPEDTEVMVDERFILPAPEQKLYPLNSLNPVKKAIDQDGRDVTQTVVNQDGRYVDSFDLTAYQGLAKEHYLEVHLGKDIPEDKPIYLVANGWVYPTDSSINVAISQGDHEPPHGIYLQVSDGEGGWKTVKKDIGFPAGKTKTVLINLSDLPLDSVPTELRLSTNMELYWDRISWASAASDSNIKTHKLQPKVADLRYRGFSDLKRESRFVPELPDYQTISSTTPQWIDLIGYYTRFGDVRELVQDIDDRYVIMNAGDELLFRFEALPPPPEGWERDYVLVGDGWVKDGDYNTGFSKTVRPLPYHGMEDYSEPPGELEDDPVYQKHKVDWARYHTRYITPQLFRSALRFNTKADE